MDEQTNSQINSGTSTKLIIPVVVAALVIFGLIGVFAYQKMNTKNVVVTPSVTPAMTKAPTYKDGTYKAVGDYVSPGGPREIDLSLTLKDGIVTASTFEGHATDPNSMRFQGEFKDGYKQFVVGKNIDEISITKVSGSSLTPKGFNDALEKIKTEAKA